MARITVEDCLKKVDNRFELIHLCAKRVRQLRKGSEPLVKSKNTDTVVALREIAEGKVFQADEDDVQNLLIDNDTDFDSPIIPNQTSQETLIGKEPVQEEVSVEE